MANELKSEKTELKSEQCRMKSEKSRNKNRLILRRFLLLFLLFLGIFTACDSPDATECLKTAGKSTSRHVELADFNRIHITGAINLIVRQDSVQRVRLTSGENIIDEIILEVQEGILTARYEDACNLVRDYASTQLIVTTPQLIAIRNGSIYDVRGEGRLNFPQLRLESTVLNTDLETFYNSGGFDLDINTNMLKIESNGKALFRLQGEANQFNITFADKTARLEATQLITQDIYVFHRSANQIYINPQQSLNGIITGVGDVIAVNRPPEISVEERYSGRLLFQMEGR